MLYKIFLKTNKNRASLNLKVILLTLKSAYTEMIKNELEKGGLRSNSKGYDDFPVGEFPQRAVGEWPHH